MGATSSIIVQKYGGTSVGDPEQVRRVAERVVSTRRAGHHVVVVVSAMGRSTDDLLALARQVSQDPPRRELDMLLSCGERMSMSLLSMAIQQQGCDAISFTGSQCGIITTHSHNAARIIEVRPFRIQDELERGRVVIVAGFQGVSYKREITTLGRGGSDTTAVALAAALGAERCEIYSDVDGVYSADPRVVPQARPLPEIGYEEMQELAASGAAVLNEQAVEYAKKAQIALYLRRSDGAGGETLVRRGMAELIRGVRGVPTKRGLVLLTLRTERHDLGAIQRLLSFLDAREVPSRQLTSYPRIAGGRRLDLLLSLDNLPSWPQLAVELARSFGEALTIEAACGALSLVGEGLVRDHATVLRAQALLDEQGIPLLGLHTSRFRITLLMPPDQMDTAAKLLHQALVAADIEAQ